MLGCRSRVPTPGNPCHIGDHKTSMASSGDIYRNGRCGSNRSVPLSQYTSLGYQIFEKKDMQANLMGRKNLHVIRLFGESKPAENVDELDAEDITDKAVSMLSRVAEIIKRNGIILIEDFEEPLFSHKELRKAFIELFENQKQIYIFNCKEKDKYLSYLESKGIAVLTEKSVNAFFEEFLPEDSDFNQDQTERSISFYIEAGKKAIPTIIEKKQLIETLIHLFRIMLNS